VSERDDGGGRGGGGGGGDRDDSLFSGGFRCNIRVVAVVRVLQTGGGR